MAHNDQRMKTVFPSFFPKDCPPNDAQSSADEFFRLVRAHPPEDNDFRSHVELGINGRFDRCIGSGLSVFTELNDIYKLKRRVKGFEKRRVARGKHAESRGQVLKGFFAGKTLREIKPLAIMGFANDRLKSITKRGTKRSPVTVSKEVA